MAVFVFNNDQIWNVWVASISLVHVKRSSELVALAVFHVHILLDMRWKSHQRRVRVVADVLQSRHDKLEHGPRSWQLVLEGIWRGHH